MIMQVLILLVLCAGAGWLLWSHLQSVKAEDAERLRLAEKEATAKKKPTKKVKKKRGRPRKKKKSEDGDGKK